MHCGHLIVEALHAPAKHLGEFFTVRNLKHVSVRILGIVLHL